MSRARQVAAVAFLWLGLGVAIFLQSAPLERVDKPTDDYPPAQTNFAKDAVLECHRGWYGCLSANETCVDRYPDGRQVQLQCRCEDESGRGYLLPADIHCDYGKVTASN